MKRGPFTEWTPHLRVTDMKEYEFVCPACGQRIPADGAMRDAIVANGCPVCSAAADADCFGPR